MVRRRGRRIPEARRRSRDGVIVVRQEKPSRGRRLGEGGFNKSLRSQIARPPQKHKPNSAKATTPTFIARTPGVARGPTCVPGPRSDGGHEDPCFASVPGAGGCGRSPGLFGRFEKCLARFADRFRKNPQVYLCRRQRRGAWPAHSHTRASAGADRPDHRRPGLSRRALWRHRAGLP